LQARQTGQRQTVEITLPATLLTRSDYLVMLTGITPTSADKVGTYHFSVIKR
jgi:hypothetical protein